MPLSSPKVSHLLAVLFGLIVAMPSLALAQTAPVIGDHYAARASDTGFEGAVNSNGGYGASIPLDLPAAQGGLPVPLEIVFGGNRVGAAGLGWDVQLSFIHRDVMLAHRRPANNPDTAPQPREQLSLTLGGSSTELVASSTSTWLARRGDAQMQVRDVGGAALEMYDGNGLKYVFSSKGGTAGSRLDNGNLYMLTDIFGPGGSNVHVEYKFGAPALPGATALSIDVANVRYNLDATGTCMKHQINLIYDVDAVTPLSMVPFGSIVLARMHKLGAVEMTARADSPDPQNNKPCDGAIVSLRKYNFIYQADADIGLPRLQQVTMIGQQGTPERNVTLPVATYSYGQFTGSDGKISYQLSQGIPMPPDFVSEVNSVAATLSSQSEAANAVNTATLTGLVDLNGDGRPDLVLNAGAHGPEFARNTPQPGGMTGFVKGSALDGDKIPLDESLQPTLGESSDLVLPVDLQDGANAFGVVASTNFVWRKLIDMNGDGRLDLVVADEQDGVWVVYLNTPDPADPNHTIWKRRTIGIAPILVHLLVVGLDPKATRLPLSRSYTSNVVHFHQCWQWDGSTWSDNPDTIGGYLNGSGSCTLPQSEDSTRGDFGSIAEEGEFTWVEWDLRDINGDGYPDFVFNGSPVHGFFEGVDAPAPLPLNTQPGRFMQTVSTWTAGFTGSTAVYAMINVAGVHFDPITSAFSSPIILQPDAQTACGVEAWQPGAAGAGLLGRSTQVCGYEDVNGDGIADRVISSFVQANVFTTTAQLGTGNANAPFAGPQIVLPGPLAQVQQQTVAVNDSNGVHFVPAICPADTTAGTFTYPIQRIAGLRDINGDGIPDYIIGTNATPGVPLSGTTWTVDFGTGTGFTLPVAVNAPAGLELSLEFVDCHGRAHGNTFAATTRGLYDIDGDGLPEVVEPGSGVLDVYQHVGGVGGNLAAGRLIKIDNGYGASTNITYRSAKEDASTNHLLPYPEVVVTSVATTDSAGNPLAAPSLYAYGNAGQFFDAAADSWVFPGYGRHVLLQNAGNANAPSDSVASISDSYPLAAFDPNADPTTRLLRYLKAGRPRDVTALSDITSLAPPLGSDPWALLAVDVTSDLRRNAASHMDYSAQMIAAGLTGNEYCVDMVDPYDYGASLAYKNDTTHPSFDQCAERGFALATSTTSYQGTPIAAAGTAEVISSANVVTTGSVVTGFDTLGRVTDSINKGDLADPSDDLCVHVDYAQPQGVNTTPTPDATVHVLNAVAGRTVHAKDCSGVTLAQDSFEYDNLAVVPPPQGSTAAPTVPVSTGFQTAQTVTRYDMDTNAVLGTPILQFDATYSPVGNLKSISKTRGDGATQTTKLDYDSFNLGAVSLTSTATNADGTVLPTLTSSILYDAVTHNVSSMTDANTTVRGTSYDGFGRATLSKITPPGGSEGVLSSMSYNGFALGSTGRSIVQKAFMDAVPVGNVGSATGRVGTTYLDSLGRATGTQVQLGADNQNQILVVGQRTYDQLGRVLFAADPFPSTGSSATAYGTTAYFNTDRTANCSVRGSGVQALTFAVDETNEVYPTCFHRQFNNNQVSFTTTAADAMLNGSPQLGVSREVIKGATGRVLNMFTRTGDNILEAMSFGYDALGHRTSMTRLQNPNVGTNNQVTTKWHYDSLGWMTKLEEQGVAPQIRTFDSWGEITQVQWCDDLSVAPCPSADRRALATFDGRGRLIHGEDQANGSANPVPGTAMDYTYDVGVNTATSSVTATNMLGRLATASWSTGTAALSYDAFGRVNAKVFTDTTVTPNNVYVERHDFHDDGSEKILHLVLPDNGGKDEQVSYTYDSIGRPISAVYNDGTSSQSLFSAPASGPIYDVFGRITAAQYGLASFNAAYAAAGRQLLNDVKVTSGDQAHSHEINFPVLNGVKAYDPLGRERQRRESQDGAGNLALLRSYDAIGRVAAAQNLQIDTNATLNDRAFGYDQLGNIASQTDASSGTNAGSASLTYQAPDFDRVCSVAYGAATPPMACNVSYDGAGNTLTVPTNANSVMSTSGTRTLTYFPGGQVSTIADGASKATFTYDAFGAVQQLVVNTPQADMRQDKHFGGLIKQRIEGSQSILDRMLPAPGVTATRHGPTGSWTFAFGEARGTRFVTDETGAFVQSMDYQPFGEVKKNSPGATPGMPNATPGTTKYTSEQWNGGDLLSPLGVVQLGARVYDPVIGRFLSRDPLLIPRTAATTNPYAFAMNDPINAADPSGRDPIDHGESPPSQYPTSSIAGVAFTSEQLDDDTLSYLSEHITPIYVDGRGFFSKAYDLWRSAQDGFGIPDALLGAITDPLADAYLKAGGLRTGCLAEMANSGCEARAAAFDTPQNRAKAKPFISGGLKLLIGLVGGEVAGPAVKDILGEIAGRFSRIRTVPDDPAAGKPPGRWVPDDPSTPQDPSPAPGGTYKPPSLRTASAPDMVREARSVVRSLPADQRAAALRYYVREQIPNVQKSVFDETWDASRINTPNDGVIWNGFVQGAEKNMVFAIGVNPVTSELHYGFVDWYDLLAKGFSTPGFGAVK